MLKKSMLGLSLMTAVIAADAQAFNFKGIVETKTPITSPITALNNGVNDAESKPASRFKTVYLMKANLSDKELRAFSAFNPRLGQTQTTTQGLPSNANVGMGNVPVLDQGSHGSCVTFATTAALDALLGKEDYVSQLCNLSLGRYLEEERSDQMSGWDGSDGPTVLNQLLTFGFINKDKQKSGVCGSMKEYPVDEPKNTGIPMSLEDFHKERENLNENLYWETILNSKQRILNAYDHTYNADAVLLAVKKALTTKLEGRDTRVTFGVMLPVQYCSASAGACGKYQKNNDTWVLTDDINYDLRPRLAGHEMVIIGYDDTAEVTEVTTDGTTGKTHKGILILRNSWGKEAGDNGNFYMTYDFFKKFAYEVQKVVLVTDEDLLKQQ